MDGKRLAALFPGIGYHCDKPLLYYSAKLARAAGYAVMPVPYAGFPEKVRALTLKFEARFSEQLIYWLKEINVSLNSLP